MTAVSANIDQIAGFLKKNDKAIIGRMLNGMSFFNDPTLGKMFNLRTETVLPKYTGAKGARQLNTDILKAKSKGAWGKRNIVPRYGMKILRFVPNDYLGTYFSEFVGVNDKKVPFEAFIMNEEMKTLAAEINDNIYLSKFVNASAYDALKADYAIGDYAVFGEDSIVYKAIATPATGESPGTAAAKWEDADASVMMDGPGTIIVEEITAGNLAAYAGGAYDNTDAYGVIKGQWEDDVTEAIKNSDSGMVAYVSFAAAEDIAQDQNTKFGSGKGIANADIEEGVPFYLKHTNKRLLVIPSLWMGTSRRIIITKRKNLHFGTDILSDSNSIGKVIEDLHGYTTLSKWVLNSQIGDLEVLSVNNQL
jgi:hypothetical protein